MKFEPVSYDHAASLIGHRPWEVSRNSALLVEAHQKVIDLYHTDSCVVGVDIYNLEIEAYGCDILDVGGNKVPVAGDPVFEEVEDLFGLSLDPGKDGRLPLIFEAAETLAIRNPEVDIRLPLAGPFTIASHLLSMEDLICECFTDPESTAEALMHMASQQRIYAELAVEKGHSVTVFESSVTPPILSPQLFCDCVLPSLQQMLVGLETDGGSQLIIGGDTLQIQEAICSSGATDIICPVETDQAAFMSGMEAFPGMSTRVNMSPAVFLPGRQEAARREAQRVLDLVSGHEQVSVGSLIPFEADPELVLEIAAQVQQQ